MSVATMALRLSLVRAIIPPGFRPFSSKYPEGIQHLVDKIVVTNDGKMIVSWHPDTPFPYEMSKPIPNIEKLDSTSLLKEDKLDNAMKAFKNKHPEAARQELMSLTYTTKHRWFPRSRDKRAKKTPMERPYL
ncbi:39S ribosomal protein L42, mitochondrial [Hermetia illucens]|nr:39S ribosomal protein L42, mitochondrial [Hermetia illucens]